MAGSTVEPPEHSQENSAVRALSKAAAGLRYFLQVLVRRDDRSRYVLAEALARQVYPRYKFSEFGRLIDYDADFIEYYKRYCGTVNYHSLDRKYTLDQLIDRKSTRLNSSHLVISYAVFCLKKKIQS